MKKVLFILSICILTGATAFSQTVAELYKQVSPSVVVLYTQEKVPTGGLKQQMATADGLGSGVLVSDKGDILTAAHVVHNAEHIMVSFPDGVKVSAKVIGSVVAADLAHIRLDWMPENRIIAKIGNSDLLLVNVM